MPPASSPSVMRRLHLTFTRGETLAGSSLRAYVTEVLGETGAWVRTRPLWLWRLLHAVSCLAAAVTRVNVPSAVYLFFFVAQVSMAPGGGSHGVWKNRAEMSRVEVLHAWFTQR